MQMPAPERPPARWVDAPCVPDLDTEADVELLDQAFGIARLADNHPVRELWMSSTPEARWDLHHLADDVRVVGEVPGAKRLLKMLRKDAEGFFDFRYELRMAAAVARSSGQRLDRLAGPDAGPDIEFTSKSGHRCGIACYRAKPSPPSMAAAREALRRIATTFRRRFLFFPLAEDLLIEMTFPSFPIGAEVEKSASDLVYDFWLQHDAGEAERDGVKVRRLRHPNVPRFANEKRRARLRFLMPVRAAERARVLGHLGNKLPSEARSWAARFDGVALSAIEESSSIQTGALRAEVEAHLREPDQPFAGVLLTYYPLIGMENVTWVARPGDARGLHIGVETFGTNTAVWAGDAPRIAYTPDLSNEEWEFVQTSDGTTAELLLGLTLGTHEVRLPPLKPGVVVPTDDPDFEPNVRRALEKIQAEMAKPLVSTGFRGFLPDADVG